MALSYYGLDYNDQHAPRFLAPPFPFSLGRGGGSADLLTGKRYGSDAGQRGALDGRYQVLAGAWDRAGSVEIRDGAPDGA